MNYPRENLIRALQIAIIARTEDEEQAGGEGYESAFVAGMKQVKEALERGENLRLT